MKRVLASGMSKALIALLLVAAIIGVGGGIGEINPFYLQIYQTLILAGGGILATIVGIKYQAQKKKQSNAVKGFSKAEKDLLQRYQNSLRDDPHIAHLQILDMNRFLEIKNIYIQLRIHQETRLSFELDATLRDAASGNESDPVQLLKANRLRIESRATDAMDPVKVIAHHKHCVIVGDPGTGKTTLLKYLTLKSIGAINEPSTYPDNLPVFPIYIELNAFASSGSEGLLEFAATLWKQRYNIDAAENVIKDHMEHRLAEGEALLLLDALDETFTGTTKEEAEKTYLRVVNKITNLSTSYRGSSIVVTVRKAAYHQLKKRLDGFTEFEVLDFRSEDIKQFVKNWFANHLDAQKSCNAYDLLDRLERNPRIQALAANPLLLSLIIIVYEAQLDLPERRSELYKRCVFTLLEDWDKHRGIHRWKEFELEHKRKLLEEVAWHFYLRRQYFFPEDDLLAIIDDFLPRVAGKPEQKHRLLEEITAEHGLLKEQVKGLYGFLHLTLQEYFVAQYALDHNQLDALLAHRWDPRWEEVILLFAGSISDLNPLLQKLLGQTTEGPLQEDFFNDDLILAGRSLATLPPFQKISMRSEVEHRLLDKLKNTDYSLTRTRIANVLVEIGAEDLLYYRLLPMFFNKQENTGVRRSIAEALCTQGGQAVAHDLLRRLAQSQDDLATCQTIAEVLGMQGEPSVAQDLLRLFTDDQIVQNVDVRLSIVEALGELGECSIARDLVRILSMEKTPSVREGIAYALGMLGEKSVAGDLLHKLVEEENAHVRRSIAEALGTLGEHKVARDLVQILSMEKIPLVREGIAYALGMLGEKSVAGDLLHKLSLPNNENTHLRQTIATALGMLGETSVVPTLQNLFSREADFSVRGSIAAALGKLGDRSMIPELLQLLFTGQTDPMVCRRIADALSTLGEPSSVLELLRQLANPQIDASVLALLRQLANPQIDMSVRSRIAIVLGQLDKRAAVPALLQLLSNQQLDPYVREHIAIILEPLSEDEEAVCTLITLLEGSDIADRIHRTLWTICRRAGVTIMRDTYTKPGGLKIVKWENMPTLQHTIVPQQAQQAVPLSKQNRTPTSTDMDDIATPRFIVPRLMSLPSHASRT